MTIAHISPNLLTSLEQLRIITTQTPILQLSIETQSQSPIFAMLDESLTIPTWMKWKAIPVTLDPYFASAATSRTLTPTVSVPCRRCLHDTVQGQEVILLSYDPFFGDSPYRSRSPIFVHADGCHEYGTAPEDDDTMPLQQRSKLLSIRGFDQQNMMVRAELLEDAKALQMCEEMLMGGGCEYIHIHYARYGCFAVKVERRRAEE
ncbi:hypothetical protein LTR33_010222 [Friedmanniomyces endolithicus]|nr:hypothetical protein LTR33_010222 [Friedmanniomyces endolithicus]